MADLTATVSLGSGELSSRMSLSAALTGLQGGALAFEEPGQSTLSAQLLAVINAPKTGAGSVSADAGNALRLGDDGGLYAPEPQLASAQW